MVKMLCYRIAAAVHKLHFPQCKDHLSTQSLSCGFACESLTVPHCGSQITERQLAWDQQPTGCFEV